MALQGNGQSLSIADIRNVGTELEAGLQLTELMEKKSRDVIFSLNIRKERFAWGAQNTVFGPLIKNITAIFAGDDAKLTQEGAFTGSPAYMSPEQAAGRQQLDARSDIYNVGAVGYFLITGQLLFDRGSFLQMLHAHAYEPFVPVQQFQEAVDPDLQRVLLRCLEKDPDRRYQDATSLDKALAECACAGQWTLERAEDWWRQRIDSTVPALSQEELPQVADQRV